MAYIGNARTLLLFAANVKDDITPGYKDSSKLWPQDGPFDKTQFELSQEVPGGYEQNIVVIRQKYIKDILVESTELVSIEIVSSTQLKLVCNDAALAASLSSIHEPANGYDGTQTIIISGSSTHANNATFVVEDVIYDGLTIQIVAKRNGSEVASQGESLTITYGRPGSWEILEEIHDYTIKGTDAQYNKLIELSEAPQIEDKVYVLHRGDATYNFVPSPNSVGPDQLSHNLRNFVCDRYTGDGSKTKFTLTQDVVNSRAIIITVDGIIQEGDDEDAGISDGLWALDAERTAKGEQTITFKSAPDVGKKIRILHLGFSTVSRRHTLSPGQVGALADGSVTTSKLANSAVTGSKIDVNAVTNTKIANNEVSGAKILLNHGEAIRSKQETGTAQTELLKLESNATTIDTPTTTRFKVASVTKLNLSSTELSPETTNDISLGNTTKKFKNLHLEGTAHSKGIVVDGDISLTGKIDGADISDLKAAFDILSAKVDALIPVGTIMLWTKNQPQDANWLLCDGSEVNRAGLYAGLFAQIGTSFGSGNGTTTFNLPDLQRRYVVGKSSLDALGNNEGIASVASRSLTHTHAGAPHTHDLSNHTHTVFKHYHHFGTLSSGAWSSGSDLAISTSGTHNTTIDIGHSHTASCSLNTTSVSVTSSLTGISAATGGSSANLTVNDDGHTHHRDIAQNTYHGNGTGYTFDSNPAHSHTGSIGGDGAHKHSIRRRGASGSHNHDTSNSDINRFATQAEGSGTSDQGSGYTGGNSNEGGHSHTLTVDSQSINHYHAIPSAKTNVTLSQTAHSHDVTITDPRHSHAISDPGHSHTVGISTVTGTRTDTGGTHTHTTTNFTGKLGQVIGGRDGNTDVASGTPSNNNTGVASYTGSSGAGVSPYIVLNYVIKAA